MIEKRRMTKFQLKNAFEYFNEQFTKPGKTAVFSYFIYDNHERLLNEYLSLQNAMYDEQRDPQYKEYVNKLNELKAKYAQKDETGKVVVENNDAVIDKKNTKAFTDAVEKLNGEYEELNKRLQGKTQHNNELLGQVVEIDVQVLTPTQMIPECPPYIVGLFYYGAL